MGDLVNYLLNFSGKNYFLLNLNITLIGVLMVYIKG